MSCHGCAEKFGFLKKEYGCPKCGFAYCKKCLRFQVMDPKTSKVISVCVKCQEAIMSPKREPIDVMRALHRLESMDDPAKPPITVYRQPPVKVMKLEELKRGLSLEDQQILERLESLKKDHDELMENAGSRRKSERMEDEIAERLAKLKGEEYNPESQSKPMNFRNVKPETEEDVIARFAAEVEMDTKYESSLVSDIEARLAKLRGEKTSGSSFEGPSPSFKSAPIDPEIDELTEEEQINLMIQRIQDDLALEKRVGGSAMDMDISEPVQESTESGMDSDEDIDVDELCGICSEKRATLKCPECDGDIFCNSCFKELHLDLGENHKATIIKAKK